MRGLASCILILSIAAQSLGKTAILVRFYAFRKQIAEKECVNKIRPVTMCYGSCYLAKKMKEDEADKKAAPLPSSLKTLKETILYPIRLVPVQPSGSYLAAVPGYARDEEHQVLRGIAADIFHPPCLG